MDSSTLLRILFSETRTFLRKIFDIEIKLRGHSTKYQEAVIDKGEILYSLN